MTSRAYITVKPLAGPPDVRKKMPGGRAVCKVRANVDYITNPRRGRRWYGHTALVVVVVPPVVVVVVVVVVVSWRLGRWHLVHRSHRLVVMPPPGLGAKRRALK